MAAEKNIVPAPAALQAAATGSQSGPGGAGGTQGTPPGSSAPSATPPEAPAASEQPAKPKFKFEKLFGVADTLFFKDGTSFNFRIIPLATGGFSPVSSLITDDEKLANNLREFTSNPHSGVREVKIN